jgi:uncharacterized membrane protein
MLLAALTLATGSLSQAAEFKILGSLFTIPPGQYPPVAFGDVLAISADGQVAAGRDNNLAFYWTAQTGMQRVPMYDGYTATYVHDISADGKVLLVDMQKSVSSYQYTRQVLWSPTFGLHPLNDDVWARALSHDGQISVGQARDPAILSHAGTWTELGDLPSVPMGYELRANGIALDISVDGSTIIGQAGELHYGPHRLLGEAFRWTADEGMQGLGFLPGHKESVATSVSDNGKIVVGASGEFDVPFRWTKAEGMKPLDMGQTYRKVVISGDGDTIAWAGSQDGYMKAKIWTELEGTRWADDVLTSAGIDLEGYTIAAIYSISTDGRTFAGVAVEKYYRTVGQPFVATLNVPEPRTCSIGVAGFMISALFARKRLAAA